MKRNKMLEAEMYDKYDCSTCKDKNCATCPIDMFSAGFTVVRCAKNGCNCGKLRYVKVTS